MFTKLSFKKYNYLLFILVTAVMFFGVYVISFAKASLTNKQLIGVLMAIVVMLVLSFIDYHFICKLYWVIYIVNIVMLLAVLLFGKEVNNAKRWFVVSDFLTVQPSELSKILLIIFVAMYLCKKNDEEKLSTPFTVIKYLVFIGIPLLLIFRQPDLSTTLCITFVLMTLYYISGLSYKVILIAVLILVPFASVFIWYIQQPDQKLLYSHQVSRILSFIYPSEYGDAQQDNSVMAIGSGGLDGKAFSDSDATTVTDSNLISEQQTDFIFSVVGEEFGFKGSVVLIAILLLIVLQCIRVSRRARDMEGSLLAAGVGCLIGFQSFINIGVATSVLPNTGIPLPFISYGLSSLLSVALGIGIVLNVSAQVKKF